MFTSLNRAAGVGGNMETLSRRGILELTSLGFGRVVLSHLLAENGGAAPSPDASVPIYNNLHARPGHFPGQAKAVIQLIQNGGPSQMDLFDPKPMLAKYAGQPHPDGVEIHQPGNKNTLLPTPFEFRKHGQCGMDVSEVLPQQAEIVDKLCFIRSMHTEHNNHLEGLNVLLTCKIFPGRPVMGSWISYALGTENQNLPAYVVLRDPKGYTIGGKQLWANGYLPALYQGVEFNMAGSPVHHLEPADPLPPGVQRGNLDYLARLNALHREDRPGESELESRIENFELAARMQVEATDVLDIKNESAAMRKLYGVDDPVRGSLRYALPDGAPAGGGRRAVRPSHDEARPALGPPQQDQARASGHFHGNRSRRRGAHQGPRRARPARQHDRDVGG